MHEDINIAFGNLRRRLQFINDFQQTLVITKKYRCTQVSVNCRICFKSYVIKFKNAFLRENNVSFACMKLWGFIIISNTIISTHQLQFHIKS